MMLHQLITEAAKDKKELSRRAWPNGQGIGYALVGLGYVGYSLFSKLL